LILYSRSPPADKKGAFGEGPSQNSWIAGTYVPQPPREKASTTEISKIFWRSFPHKARSTPLTAPKYERRQSLLPGFRFIGIQQIAHWESSALNPGVAWNTVLPNVVTQFPSGRVNSPQSFSLVFGGTLSSHGTREDKFSNYWNLDKLKHFNGGTCPETPQPGSSLLLESELGISQWLQDHLIAEVLLPSSEMPAQSNPAFKQDILSYHVKFIIISSGSVTPTWKLVRISTGNGNLALASINRTRTHDLLITFGPAFRPGTANVALSSHLAQEIGNRSVERQ
jgi:hypothetical protein